jgi:hypothetical protein
MQTTRAPQPYTAPRTGGAGAVSGSGASGFSLPLMFASSPVGLTALHFQGTDQFGAPQHLCVNARNGLGSILEIGGRPLVLTSCTVGAAPISLVDGVLYIGEGRTHQIVPIAAPVSGCRLVDVLSQVRRTLIGVCQRADADPSLFEEDLAAPGWGRITGQSNAPGPAFSAGVVLMATPIAPDGPAIPAWSFAPATGQIGLLGSDLCMTPPPGDVSLGAPVMLRPCDQGVKGAQGARFAFAAGGF